MRALAPLALLLAGCLQVPTLAPDATVAPQAGGPIPLAIEPGRDRETDVAVNPRDPQHVAVFRNVRPDPYVTGSVATDPITPGILQQVLSVTRDGGATWTHATLPHAGAAAPGSEWAAWCLLADPNVLFDREGVIHITTLAVSCGGPALSGASAVLHATTADDGATWSEPITVMVGAGGLAGLFNDREWTAYDPATGAWAIAWTAFAAGRSALMVSFSPDGRSWFAPQEIHSATGTATRNYLVHAAWLDERLRIAAHGCGTAQADRACLTVFTGTSAGWERSEMTLESCGLEGAALGYATSAVDSARGRMYVAAPVLNADNEPVGTCIFASMDAGRTFPVARGLADSDHPWLAMNGEDPVLVHLRRAGDLWVPTANRLAPNLADRWTMPVGPALDMDTDGNGELEYGDYDGMAVGGGRFFWALTHPNQEGRAGGDTFDDLDIWVYHGSLG